MFQVTVTTPPSDWCFRSQLQLHLLTDVLGHCYNSTFWLMFQVTVTTPPSDWCFRSLLRLTFWLMFQVTVTTPPSDWCFRSLLWLHLLTDVSGHCYDSTSMQPPRGLQFILGTATRPAVVDTIVMANLVSHFVCSCTLGSMSCPCMNGMSPRQSPGRFYVTWWLNFRGAFVLRWACVADRVLESIYYCCCICEALCPCSLAQHVLSFLLLFFLWLLFFLASLLSLSFPFFPFPVFLFSFFVVVVLCLFVFFFPSFFLASL